MKSVFLALSVLTLATVDAGFVRQSVKLVKGTSTAGSPRLIRRQDDVTIYNEEQHYTMVLSLGDPGQDVEVIVDTGSHELWLNPNCDGIDNSYSQRVCESTTQFDWRESDSLESVSCEGPGNGFIRYGSGEVTFDCVEDYVGIGGR